MVVSTPSLLNKLSIWAVWYSSLVNTQPSGQWGSEVSHFPSRGSGGNAASSTGNLENIHYQSQQSRYIGTCYLPGPRNEHCAAGREKEFDPSHQGIRWTGAWMDGFIRTGAGPAGIGPVAEQKWLGDSWLLVTISQAVDLNLCLYGAIWEDRPLGVFLLSLDLLLHFNVQTQCMGLYVRKIFMTCLMFHNNINLV